MTDTETTKQKMERFRQRCLSVLAKSGNCQASQSDFSRAQTVAQMCSAWRKYWQGLVSEVPEAVIEAFEEYYTDTFFRQAFNAEGLYYNEDCGTGQVIVGDSNEPIRLRYTPRAYVLGAAFVELHGRAFAYGLHPECCIELFDQSRAAVQHGFAIARGCSQLSTCQNALCYDRASVRITDGMLTDRGHADIRAFGHATVRSFTKRNITLYDQATLII